MTAKKPSGSDLRAMRDARAATENPAGEAVRHEASFLRNMTNAKEDFDWILANSAWAMLGFDTFAGWWDERVRPVAAGLAMRPTPELAKKVVERVLQEQKSFPKAQRRTQQQIAEMVGLSKSTVSRSLSDADGRRSDLDEEPPTAGARPEAAIDAMRDALKQLDAHLSRPAPPPGDAAVDSSEDDDGDETEPEVSTPPSSVDVSASVDQRERAGSGVTQPAPAPAIPSWLRAVTAVCAAVHDLAEEDAASVAGVMDGDLAAELGLATSRLLAWHKSMQEAVNGAIDE